MSTWETAVAGLGRLALAAESDGSPLAGPDAGPAGSGGAPEARRERAWRTGLGLAAAATYAVAGACWLRERRTLTRRGLDKDARAAVAVKDVFVAGAVLTGVARLLGEATAGREAPAGAARRRRRLTAVRLLNRAFVAGAVAATPFINFALFNDYRPRPLRGFLSL